MISGLVVEANCPVGDGAVGGSVHVDMAWILTGLRCLQPDAGDRAVLVVVTMAHPAAGGSIAGSWGGAAAAAFVALGR